MYVEAIFIEPGIERSLVSVWCSDMPAEGDVWTYDGESLFRVWRVFGGKQSFQRCFNCIAICLYPA